MVERAYKYRFFPTPAQENLLRRTMGCVRLVYNKALAAKTEGWYERQERIDLQTNLRDANWLEKDRRFGLSQRSLVVYLCSNVLDICKRLLLISGVKELNILGLKQSVTAVRLSLPSLLLSTETILFGWAKSKEPLNIVWSRFLPDGSSPSTVTIKLEPSGRWFVSLLVDDVTVQTIATN